MKILSLPRLSRLIALFALSAGLIMVSCKSSKRSSRSYRPTVNRPVNEPRPASMPEPAASREEEESRDEKALEALREAEKMRMMNIDRVLQTANSYMGTKHRMGGMSKSGIDCSGLVVVSYKSIDLPLPRSSSQQIGRGKAVDIKELQRGDLVFFTYPGGKRVTHVGIVQEVRGEEDVTFIHTSSSKGVRVDNVFSDYWRKVFVGARRVL